MSKNKNPKIVYPQLLNPATGEFKISNDFIFSGKTTPDDLKAYFGEDKLVVKEMKSGHSNYATPRLEIGELYFYFTFYFFNKIITRVSFNVYAKPSTIENKPQQGKSGWDNFSEEENIKGGKFMEKWLADQINIDINTYAWGKANTSYDFHNLSTSCTIDYRDVITGEKLKQIL